MARIEALESLASREVGKSGSPLVFVSVNGEIVAAFVKRRGFDDPSIKDLALDFARNLGERAPVVLEDSSGVDWENRHAQRIQQQDDD